MELLNMVLIFPLLDSLKHYSQHSHVNTVFSNEDRCGPELTDMHIMHVQRHGEK